VRFRFHLLLYGYLSLSLLSLCVGLSVCLPVCLSMVVCVLACLRWPSAVLSRPLHDLGWPGLEVPMLCWDFLNALSLMGRAAQGSGVYIKSFGPALLGAPGSTRVWPGFALY
jgi:uncharacterized membrane protein YhaH (DUF805 family)